MADFRRTRSWRAARPSSSSASRWRARTAGRLADRANADVPSRHRAVRRGRRRERRAVESVGRGGRGDSTDPTRGCRGLRRRLCSSGAARVPGRLRRTTRADHGLRSLIRPTQPGPRQRFADSVRPGAVSSRGCSESFACARSSLSASASSSHGVGDGQAHQGNGHPPGAWGLRENLHRVAAPGAAGCRRAGRVGWGSVVSMWNCGFRGW
jgi:hypothetical protein